LNVTKTDEKLATIRESKKGRQMKDCSKRTHNEAPKGGKKHS
jgi:hypothetical protein